PPVPSRPWSQPSAEGALSATIAAHASLFLSLAPVFGKNPFPGGTGPPIADRRSHVRFAPGVRMSLSPGLIASIAFAYLALLFAIAFYGDRRKAPPAPRMRGWIYSMSLAVYCTSWTFFGAVGQSTDQLWAFLPIYLGPILLLMFAPWVVQKMMMISKQENITSIADFIAARYGKSQALAITIALICLVGVLPY